MGETPLDTTINVLLPVDFGEVRLGLGKEKRVYATVEMSISRGGRIPGDHDDGAHGAVLGEQASRYAGCGKDEDSSRIEVEGGSDGGHSA